jgi:MYXO-CTERM domain-containing protein
MSRIFTLKRPAWDAVRDAKSACNGVRIEYEGMVFAFASLGALIFVAAAVGHAKANTPYSFYVLGGGLAFLGLSAAAAMRRRRIIRERRYSAGDIYAIIAPKFGSLLALFAVFAAFCTAHPINILILGPWAYILVGVSLPDFRGWWRCLAYLDKAHEQSDTRT